MARRVRVFLQGVPVHIILKTLNGVDLYKDSNDYEIFVKIIDDVAKANGVNIIEFAIKKDFFDFLAIPSTVNSIPKFMQTFGRRYVHYYNKKYNRVGTMWQGRYKSSIVEERYTKSVIEYIKKLKNNNLSNNKLDEFIANSLEKQQITGSIEFIKEIEKIVGMTLIRKSRGRPKKNDKEKRDMYKKLVVLDKNEHKDLKIKPMQDLNFAKNLDSIAITANEVDFVGRDFPIVFVSGKNPSLIALISLGGGNLAINEEGKWITTYVPSSLRKYPFAIASVEEDSNQKVILIDIESPLISTKEGSPLFAKDGEQSKALKNAINYLTSYEAQMQVTKNIIKEIEESGILEEREISVGEGDKKRVLVKGFMVVNKEKLNSLSDEKLADWVRRGIITFIDSHLKSLKHINTLFKLAQARQK